MDKKSADRSDPDYKEVKPSKKHPDPFDISTNLVVSAIRDLRHRKGMTPSKIIGFISYGSSEPQEKIKKQVYSVLKRGVRDGFLQKYRGTYCVSDGHEFDQKPSLLPKKNKAAQEEEEEEEEDDFETDLPEKTPKGKRQTKKRVKSIKMKKTPIRTTRKSSLVLRPKISYGNVKKTS